MNKGFTLLEIMVVVAIIMILTAGGVVAVGDRIEKNAIIRVKTELPTMITNSIDKSFSDGVLRTITFNTTEGAITITGGATTTSSITYNFPKALRYSMTPSTFQIGERGEITGLGSATQAAIIVKTKKAASVIAVRVSNISGLNLGRVVVTNE